MFEIEIKNLKTKAKIGITQKERQQYQTLLVTLRFKYKIMKTSQLNDLGYLKNYSEIIRFLNLFIKNSKYKSLEKLVHESSQVLQKEFNLKKLFISINKVDVARNYKCESISVSK